MSSDKKLIILALCICILFALSSPRIFEETKLLRQTEAIELSDDLAFSFFYPYSNIERIEVIQESIDRLKAIQERVSKSFIAKHYVDYRESISKKENDLRERKENLKTDCISFATQQLHHIISYSSHTAEKLLTFASLIDEVFPEEDLSTAVFVFEEESPKQLINVYPYDDWDIDNDYFQSFACRASKEVFNNDPIILQVGSPGSGDTELYFHDQTPPVTTTFLKETLLLPDATAYKYSFNWGYKGQMPNGCHVIWCDIDTATECYEELHILKYDQGQWTVKNVMSGCLGGEIKGEHLFFKQTVSEEVLLDQITDLFPELKPFYDRIPKRSIGTGKAGYTGTMEYSVFISEDGEALKHNIVAFYPCEGWPPFSGQIFHKEDLLTFGFDMLSEIEKR